MFHNRATASMQGRQSFCPGSRQPELHNSHFITTFPGPSITIAYWLPYLGFSTLRASIGLGQNQGSDWIIGG